jgi:hypothetical protein
MALGAATHVPAQVVFGIVFAGVLLRRGLLLGATAGTLAYVGCSIYLADMPAPFALAAAMPVVAFARGSCPLGGRARRRYDGGPRPR